MVSVTRHRKGFGKVGRVGDVGGGGDWGGGGGGVESGEMTAFVTGGIAIPIQQKSGDTKNNATSVLRTFPEPPLFFKKTLPIITSHSKI